MNQLDTNSDPYKTFNGEATGVSSSSITSVQSLISFQPGYGYIPLQ